MIHLFAKWWGHNIDLHDNHNDDSDDDLITPLSKWWWQNVDLEGNHNAGARV